MAIGSLIYVGKSRLRRKFRDQKIENRLKRIERRHSEREQKRGTNVSDNEYIQVQTQDLSFAFDANNNAKSFTCTEKHSCHFCDSFECDSLWCSEDSCSDTEDLIPLIDTISLRPTYIKMPFDFLKKVKKNVQGKEKDGILKAEEAKETENHSDHHHVEEKEDIAVKDEAEKKEENEITKEEEGLEEKKAEVDKEIADEFDRNANGEKEVAEISSVENDEVKPDVATNCETVLEEKAEVDTVPDHSTAKEALANGDIEEKDHREDFDHSPVKKGGKKRLTSEHPGSMLCCTIM